MESLKKFYDNKFAFIGLIISIFLIIFAMILVAYQQTGEITWASFLDSQKHNPVLWILNLTPFLFLILGQTSHLNISHEIKQKPVNKFFYNAQTQLPNRFLFVDLLSQTIQIAHYKKQKFSVIMVNVVNFKKINELIGRRDGTKILASVGTKLRSIIQPPNILAHLEENEFSILSFYANKNNKAQELAKQIQKHFEAPFLIDGINLKVRIVIGVAFFPDHGKKADILIRHANAAIEKANEIQVPFNIYQKLENQQFHDQNKLMKDLEEAIKNDELRLQFQPKINLSDKKMVGVEASFYWPHPIYGNLNSHDFIPLAKRMELSLPLTEWILHKSIDQYRQWHENGRSIPIAINLSLLDEVTEDILTIFSNLTDNAPFTPKMITLELPESALMINKYRCSEILTLLSELGIRFSIQNYGANYCPLSHLCELPIDEIKIDKHLLISLNQNPQNEMLIQALIALGHHLSLNVVAEGITSKQIFNQLIQWNCPQGQGPYISTPKKAFEIPDWNMS